MQWNTASQTWVAWTNSSWKKQGRLTTGTLSLVIWQLLKHHLLQLHQTLSTGIHNVTHTLFQTQVAVTGDTQLTDGQQSVLMMKWRAENVECWCHVSADVAHRQGNTDLPHQDINTWGQQALPPLTGSAQLLSTNVADKASEWLSHTSTRVDQQGRWLKPL